jgi:hypothetical protein
MTRPTDPERARQIGERERNQLAQAEPSLRQWKDAVAGTPVLVRTMSGVPSYWLVPIGLPSDAHRADQPVVGFVRVTFTGRVAAAGSFGGRARVITGITEAEARAAATHAAPRAAIESALFVHDGPPGREGWRVRVTGADDSGRTLFITAGGVTEPTGGGEHG